MAGTPEGALKTKQKNLEKDPNFYANIGKKSWDNERSRKTGFALLNKEEHLELSKKGGKKTKNEYKTTHDSGTEEAGSSTSE